MPQTIKRLINSGKKVNIMTNTNRQECVAGVIEFLSAKNQEPVGNCYCCKLAYRPSNAGNLCCSQFQTIDVWTDEEGEHEDVIDFSCSYPETHNGEVSCPYYEDKLAGK